MMEAATEREKRLRAEEAAAAEHAARVATEERALTAKKKSVAALMTKKKALVEHLPAWTAHGPSLQQWTTVAPMPLTAACSARDGLL